MVNQLIGGLIEFSGNYGAYGTRYGSEVVQIWLLAKSLSSSSL